MSEKNLTQLTPINKQNSINFIEKDGQILFSAEEIGKQLGYATPAKSINRLFQRNAFELLTYSVDVKLTSTDGKAYNKRCFTEEGVYILSMLANTDKARDFRRRVAELLKNLRQKEMDKAFASGFDTGRESGLKELAEQVELARELAYKQGMEYGQSLPAVQIESKKAYLNGLEEGKRIQKKQDNWLKMEKALDYLGKGLSLKDTAQLVGINSATIRSRFKKLGLWEQVKNGELWFNKPERRTASQTTQPKQLSLI